MTDNEHICYVLGQNAFAERARPEPARDRKFMAFARVNRHLSILPLIHAWESGFRNAADAAIAEASV
jgi:hypothetical protein